MTKRILSYGVVGLLILALVGGTAYILLNPSEAQAGRGSTGVQGQGQGRGGTWESGDATARGQSQGQGRGNAGSGVDSLGQGNYGRGQKEQLTAEEIEGVLYMREEEKLARDVYLTLYEGWELPIFQSIAGSEQTHMDAIKTLIDRYGLDDPMAGNDVGEFTDPTLQTLYTDLVAAGSQSLADALRVGAAIEEIDILDLEEHISQTDAQNIQRVYENLMRGSRNHLRSFVATLEQEAGETYEPQYLDQQAYDEIVSTPMESGGYGGGQGRGGAGQTASGGLASEAGQGRGRGSGGSEAGSFDQGAYGRGQDGASSTAAWETVTGQVTSMDGEVTIQTAEGEMLVGMGQSAYWEDFALEVGQEITVIGFYEDGEFKAGTVENLATGETIVLRDDSGRPMWSGQGRLKNQGAAGN